jgi:hypothetical protein
MGQRQAFLRPGQEGSERYQYLPLAERAIRLIHLHRIKKGELYCTIHHALLDGPVEYTALSYAWGDGDASSQINVRNENKEAIGSLPLTTNLHAAINDLWNAPGLQLKVFWIDQIAVNQEDLAERSSQVSFMTEIFRNATLVVTYLGPGTKADTAALKLMEKVDTDFQIQFVSKFKGSDQDREVLKVQSEGQREPLLDADSYRYLILGGHESRDIIKKLQIPRLDFHGRQHALELSSPSCSQRLWMVQENILNKNTCMLRGTTLIEWEFIAAFACLVNTQPAFAFVANSPLNSPPRGSMLQLWRLRKFKHPLTLMELMWTLQLYGCSDPRDMVYACMGMARDGKALEIVPDYAKAVKDVYTEVARRTLQHHQNLESLDMVVEPDLLSSHPSWAPQHWGSLSEIATGRFQIGRSNNWRASGDHLGAIRCEGNILIVDGVVLDTVSPLQILIHVGNRSFYNVLLHFMDVNYRKRLQSRMHDTEYLKREYGDVIGLEASHVQQYQAHLTEMMAWATLHGIDDDHAAAAIYCTLATIKTYPEDASAQQGLEAIRRSFASIEAQLRTLSRTVAEHPDLFNTRRKAFAITPPNYNDVEKMLETTFYKNSTGQVERTIFCTENGRFGTIHATVKEGDKIAILIGGRSVYVLRPSENDYRFVGSAYVYGLMDGEACLDPTFEENTQSIRIR